jgi:hypothetical protein
MIPIPNTFPQQLIDETSAPDLYNALLGLRLILWAISETQPSIRDTIIGDMCRGYIKNADAAIERANMKKLSPRESCSKP